MSGSEAMRKSALLASVMQPGALRSLFASLPAGTAEELRTQIAFVSQQGWNRSTLVNHTLNIWTSKQEQDIAETDTGFGDIVRLSNSLNARTLSRVVLATAPNDPTFILSALEPRIAKAVRTELVSLKTFPPALASAIRKAAHVTTSAVDVKQ
ncbi:hypothetical protein [Xanthomonas cucurbitae]|uniref:Uncharacterized protein n=1 Tax=Xanthomonas cucurbitae TaxID=56453 RepID=A0ABY7YCU0_9XANT|nr:hypothetical protein [Xanthomonas cucurbitae]WDM67826.1 hypothetical protein K6981_00330 [Xanthomonas cucurbitae]WDM71700.1 hypothetical protein K6978_00325 [Xanthomonas cucurbitae]